MNLLILGALLPSTQESNVVEVFFKQHSMAENPTGQVAVLQLLRLKEVEHRLGGLLPGVSQWFEKYHLYACSRFIAPAWSGGASSSRTPMWRQDAMSGNRTPAYGGADGGRTVNPYAEGSRTAYGGTTGSGGVSPLRISLVFSHITLLFLTYDLLSQRTPAWDPGARTSYGDSLGGSKTPAYNADSSRTPAYNSTSNTAYNDPWASSAASATTSNTAANSRPYDAPTPGKDIHAAPTPSNGYSAATPAAAAPTPKFSGYAADAPTPYSGQPETPAWGGEDGPRYEEGTPSP